VAGFAMTGEEIIGRIEEELTMVIGPLGRVVMMDKAAQFGESVESFPADKMAELVEEVSFEIQNSRRKVEFQRAALKILREASQWPAAPENSNGLKVKRE
jgi:hypothetical protein